MSKKGNKHNNKLNESGCKDAGEISKIFSPRGSDMTSKVFIKTFGWPNVQVPRDDFGDFEEVK